MTTTYPLFFTFTDTVTVRGSLVEVATRGRVLAVQEDEGWWFYGVNPGDVAQSGSNSTEALAAFRKAYTEILVALANKATTTAAFRRSSKRFLDATNEPNLKDWIEASKQVRAGKVKANLPIENADIPPSIKVTVLGAKGSRQPLTFDKQQPQLAKAA
ncbi:MAG: hypothetical protein FJ027_05155 [Candidatus Rokubacteria bacterium]|nr:hypothetical protein [Candidatus Rokubacteria bacterium]